MSFARVKNLFCLKHQIPSRSHNVHNAHNICGSTHSSALYKKTNIHLECK